MEHMLQMSVSMEQKQTHRRIEQTVVARGMEGWGRDGVGVWVLGI